MAESICIHRLPEIEPGLIPDFDVVARTTRRADLLTAIGTLDIAALIVNVDEDDAINTIVSALEIKPTVGVVGLTGGSDVKNVIAAQRAGCKQFATRPVDANDLQAALRQAITASSETKTTGTTIAVMGATGGAGSTTIACHLAVELAQVTSSPVALFDLDFEFGGVARGFDLDARFTIADLASAGAVDACLLERTAVKLPVGVHVFARPRTVQEAHAIDVRAIPPILQVASQVYRYIMLDVSHRLDPITGTAVEHCDRLLLTVQLTVPSVDNARRIIDAINLEGIPEDRVEVVVNRYRKNMHTCTVSMVEKRLHQKVSIIVPNDYHSVRNALDTGKPLAKRNPVRSAIRQAAVRLAGQEIASKRKSWLAKLGIGQ